MGNLGWVSFFRTRPRKYNCQLFPHTPPSPSPSSPGCSSPTLQHRCLPVADWRPSLGPSTTPLVQRLQPDSWIRRSCVCVRPLPLSLCELMPCWAAVYVIGVGDLNTVATSFRKQRYRHKEVTISSAKEWVGRGRKPSTYQGIMNCPK